ncbi:hypothetical protein NG819_14410 [Pseudarthrobacter sp. Fe7]|nr:hypothetical protein NG819_14410 [Pseudarthrobacter sp. Fe7]
MTTPSDHAVPAQVHLKQTPSRGRNALVRWLLAIEWRWNLAPLTARDQDARNIAEVLDFGTPANLAAPKYLVPPFVAGPACTPVGPPPAEEWSGLKEKALADGWKLP